MDDESSLRAAGYEAELESKRKNPEYRAAAEKIAATVLDILREYAEDDVEENGVFHEWIGYIENGQPSDVTYVQRFLMGGGSQATADAVDANASGDPNRAQAYRLQYGSDPAEVAGAMSRINAVPDVKNFLIKFR